MKTVKKHRIIPLLLALIVIFQNPPWFVLSIGLLTGYILSLVLLIYESVLKGKSILFRSLLGIFNLENCLITSVDETHKITNTMMDNKNVNAMRKEFRTKFISYFNTL